MNDPLLRLLLIDDSTADAHVLRALLRQSREGEFDLIRYCDTMRAKGFDGVVSVEILETDFRARGDHEEFARRVFETSARFWPPAPR